MKKLEDIFDFKNPKSLELINCEDDNNGVLFVSRTSENNWTMRRVKLLDEISPMPWNAITVALWGSVLASFYQDEPFYTSFHIAALYPKIELSKQEMLFYCTTIEANKYRYSYGRQANRTLKDVRVPSPEEIPDAVKNYKLEERIKKDPVIDEKIPLETENWKNFILWDIFDISLWSPLHSNEVEVTWINWIPYVTRKASNNWIDWYILNEYEEKLNNWRVITVGAEWFVAFYQEKNFYCWNKVNIIKHQKFDNKYIALFIVTLLDKEIQWRFSYWRGAVKWKLEKMRIKLPVTSSWIPDWQFMENYIKSLPYSSNL